MSAEARPGYKRTEIGVIPEDWGIKSLADICSFENGDRGKNYPSPGSFVSSGIPFINAGHLNNGNIDFRQMDYITPERFNKLGGGKVRNGDILFCLRGSLGKFGEITDSINCGAIASSLVIIRHKASSLTKDYLISYFSSELCANMIKAWAGGAAQPNLGAQDLAKFLIAIPQCKGEQERIISTLADTNDLISSLDQLIAKKRDIQQAVTQQLLTGQRRLPGFSEEWEEMRLGDCLLENPNYGINAPAVEYSDALPTYIRITDINADGYFAPLPRVSVDSVMSSDYLLEEGDVVFARTGASVGKSYRYSTDDGPLVFAGFLIRVRPNQGKLIPAFLAASVTTKSYWNWVRLMSMRSGQPGINANEYASFPLRLPRIEEQSAIATILSDMGAELVTLEARRDKTRQIKQGIMQELLSGKIRLS